MTSTDKEMIHLSGVAHITCIEDGVWSEQLKGETKIDSEQESGRETR